MGGLISLTNEHHLNSQSGTMKKYRMGTITIGLVSIGLVVNYYFNPYAKRFHWLETEIPGYHLLAQQDSINNRIVSAFSTRGFAYLTMKDSQKVSLGVSRNGLYKDSFIGDFLKAGDSLYKAPGMDTFYIYIDDRKYYFVLSKIVNEN